MTWNRTKQMFDDGSHAMCNRRYVTRRIFDKSKLIFFVFCQRAIAPVAEQIASTLASVRRTLSRKDRTTIRTGAQRRLCPSLGCRRFAAKRRITIRYIVVRCPRTEYAFVDSERFLPCATLTSNGIQRIAPHEEIKKVFYKRYHLRSLAR